MKLDKYYKADRGLVYLAVFMVVMNRIEALSASDTELATVVRVRNKRQPRLTHCAALVITCRLRPTKVHQCKQQRCVRVKTVLTPEPTCKVICESIFKHSTEITRNSADIEANNFTVTPMTFVDNSNNTRSVPTTSLLWTNDVSNCSLNCQNGGTCIGEFPAVLRCACVPGWTGQLCQRQQRDNANNTTTVRTTSLHWLNDTSKCAGNFECQNNGTCIGKFPAAPRCACTPGWMGSQCQNPCTLECDNNGTCIFLNETQYCLCPYNFTGSKCERLKPPEASRKYKLAPEVHPWFSYVIVFFAILVGFLGGYIVLKRLRGRSLLVTKMFYYFQPYEDDDGKEFDAFISFKSSNSDYSQSEDERFVVRTLHPKLEKELQFKVCVHYRDFMPGETIANNIMWAVENSRRTILILSPNYLQSEWGRLEYQKAQQEMLQLRHKIIPVIIEDISNTTIEDPNLTHILSSVTYIEYPGTSDEKKESKFWEMLQLSLPKKRSPESQCKRESSSSTSSFTSPSSQTLMSQESWQSARTDITEMSDDSPIEMEDVSVFIPNVPVTNPDVSTNSSDILVDSVHVPIDSSNVSVDSSSVPVDRSNVPVDSPDMSVFSPYSHNINIDQKEKIPSSRCKDSEKDEMEKTLNMNVNNYINILEMI